MVNTGIETLIVSGGDYVEDNPVPLPPDCSVVGITFVWLLLDQLWKTYFQI